MAKNYEELKLSDDFMFGKVMEDSGLCREVLECLLGKPVGELEEIELQRYGSSEKATVVSFPAGNDPFIHLYI